MLNPEFAAISAVFPFQHFLYSFQTELQLCLFALFLSH